MIETGGLSSDSCSRESAALFLLETLGKGPCTRFYVFMAPPTESQAPVMRSTPDTVAFSSTAACSKVQNPRRSYGDFPFRPDAIDAVILTHAHIDHSGLLPKLIKRGFAGPIYATLPTVDLCSVMLPDSAHIQEMEVEHLNRRSAQQGRPQVSPIYTIADVAACMRQFRPVQYGQWTTVATGMRVRYWHAGHLLGSASVEVEIDTEASDGRLRLLFSGDIGPGQKLLQAEPDGPIGVDYLICEATYGDRDRSEVSRESRRAMLGEEVRRAVEQRGPLVIPSFAVERTQELLVDLYLLARDGSIPSGPIFVDSPLATQASSVFERHAAEIDSGKDLLAACVPILSGSPKPWNKAKPLIGSPASSS